MRLSSKPGEFSLGRLSWDRRELCRGWLVTGDHGSGKTAAGTNRLMYEAFISDDVETWGGLVIDDSGILLTALTGMAAEFGRSGDLICLAVQPLEIGGNRKPAHRFNPLADLRVPTHALVDALMLSGIGPSGRSRLDAGHPGEPTSLERSIARHAIEHAIELSRAINLRVAELGPEQADGCRTTHPDLKSLIEFLCVKTTFDEAMVQAGVCLPDPPPAHGDGWCRGPLLTNTHEPPGHRSTARAALDSALRFFRGHYWSLAPGTLAGAQNAVRECLWEFGRKEIAEVFCADNTVDFSEINDGKIIYTIAPQEFSAAMQVVHSMLKAHFFTYALSRFHRSPEEIRGENMALLFAVDAHKYLSHADTTPLERMPEVNAGMIASTESIETMIGHAALATRACFPNRLLFRCSGEWDARELGGQVQPRHLVHLRDRECVAVHPTQGTYRVQLPSMGPPGWNHPEAMHASWLSLCAEVGRAAWRLAFPAR